MSRWRIYLRERFPLASYAAIAGGMCLSGGALAGSFRALPLALSFVGLLLFFALLRLMDEVKDVDKDRIAHPERPLPRGLLAVDEAQRAIRGGALAMVAFSALVALLTSVAAGALYAAVAAYLWLMYREFFRGAWLEPRPAIYAATHQIVLVPLCAFAATAARAEMASAPATYAYAASVLGAFFAYEVARKLDPKAHPILHTYLSVYGVRGVVALVGINAAIAAAGDFALGLRLLLWPAVAALIFVLVWFAVRPSAFKRVEATATLVLLLHLWGPAIARALPWIRG